MTKPVRLQLSRRRGFNLQALSLATNGLPAVNVARPSEWGNPYRVYRVRATNGTIDKPWWVDVGENSASAWTFATRTEAIAAAVKLFIAWINSGAQAKHASRAVLALRGHNLACWCKPGEPCHADVLLGLAALQARSTEIERE